MTVVPKQKSSSKSMTERWENEGGPAATPGPSGLNDVQVELERYGIQPVILTVFDWGGFRYSNAKDAIAAAKRKIARA